MKTRQTSLGRPATSQNLCLLIPQEDSHVHSTNPNTATNLCMDEPPPGARTTLLRDPSKLFFQADNTRRYIISAYWAIIILALPLWWSATSIERLSLPSTRVISQAQKPLSIPVTLSLQTESDNLLLASQLKISINERILKAPKRWKGIDVHVNHGQVLSMSFSKKFMHIKLISLLQR